MTEAVANFDAEQGVNQWQRGVHIYDSKVLTPAFLVFSALGIVGLGLSLLRMFGGLAFTGMTDSHAWGIWKTFNVMTLTALGSGGMAIGIAAWVFNWKSLHLVMRTALLTSLLFYWGGLIALGVDVGRPWNFYQVVLINRWNTHSALLEVSVCMTAYAAVFLLFENLPPVLERLYISGDSQRRKWVAMIMNFVKKFYPYFVAAAYVLPMMHQSSLGALMLLAGVKVHPLWQTQMLPLLYVIQGGVAGTSCVLFTVMLGCLVWRRRMDMHVLSDLAKLMTGLGLTFIVLRWGDLIWRGLLPMTFDFSQPLVWVFHVENLLVLVPCLLLISHKMRYNPQLLFKASIPVGFGAAMYRFVPTTISYVPGELAVYFPSALELVMGAGYIALTVAGFSWACKVFAIFPAPISRWYQAVAAARAANIKVDSNGKAIDY